MIDTTLAHAVQMERYGPPEVLRYGPVPLAPLAPREVRIRTLYAAINHTDLEIRSGAWPLRPAATFPYVPGVEVIGVLAGVGEAVSEWSPGQTVITMMQGLGGVRAERPGGYAEFVTVDADAIAKVHAEVAPAHMAALGLAGVTAFEGLRRLGAVAGRRVLVTGAAGGVGSAACALAAERGAEVVGLVSRPEQADYVRGLGATSVVIAREDEPPQIPPESVNAVFDTVGGKVFPIAVAALRAGGVLSLVGAVGGGDVAFDAWNLIRPVTLTGYSSETLTGPALREAVDALAAALRSGAIRPPQHEIVPLPQAADAHRRLEAGGVQGRILLQPATHGD